ncbi:hypothetical protein [Nonomuraea jiangxiensis]|nr:hypothetical protein [Nonomuraea jiangxiensis]
MSEARVDVGVGAAVTLMLADACYLDGHGGLEFRPPAGTSAGC